MTNITEVYEELKNIQSPNPDMHTECPKTVQFMNQKRFNQELYNELLIENSIVDLDEIGSVLVGFSGTGELVDLFSNQLEVPEVISIDERSNLLNMQDNDLSDAILISNTPKSVTLNNQADLYTVLSNETGLSQTPDENLYELFSTVYDSLKANGVFITNFVNSVQVGTGGYTEESFTDSSGTLYYQKITSRKENQLMKISRYYVETETYQDPVTVTSHSTQYIHEPYQLKQKLERAGFLRVSLSKKGKFASPTNPLVIAWK